MSVDEEVVVEEARGVGKIIALDLATKCGYAVLEDAALLDSGRWSLAPRKGHPRGERWAAFEGELTDLVRLHQPSIVAYERVRHHVGVGAAHVYGGFLASMERLEVHWGQLGIMPNIMPLEISTWRKASIGRGDACKQEVVRWVKRTFKHTPKTEDEAEAIAIAVAARRISAGEYTP